METRGMKNYEIKNEGIDVLRKYPVPCYRQTVKKIASDSMCTKDTFQKIFHKIKYFSRYFG